MEKSYCGNHVKNAPSTILHRWCGNVFIISRIRFLQLIEWWLITFTVYNKNAKYRNFLLRLVRYALRVCDVAAIFGIRPPGMLFPSWSSFCFSSFCYYELQKTFDLGNNFLRIFLLIQILFWLNYKDTNLMIVKSETSLAVILVDGRPGAKLISFVNKAHIHPLS